MLTKFNVHGIIKQLDYSVEKNRIAKIHLEVYADSFAVNPLLRCKPFKAWHNDAQMKKMNVNLKEAMNYFVHLFYQTEQKYSCTRTKLGKLLSILAFKFACNEEIIFDETIFKYPPCCGTRIKDLDFIIVKNIYVRDLTLPNFDKPSEISICELKRNLTVPPEYSAIENLSDSIINEIENVFLRFGAYPGDDLGNLLNPIVDKIIMGADCKLDILKLSKLSDKDFGVNQNNEIIKYLYVN